MRHKFRRLRHINRHIRRGVRRSRRRRGNLLGLAGLAALGYTLYDKHQRERTRGWAGSEGDFQEPKDWEQPSQQNKTSQ